MIYYLLKNRETGHYLRGTGKGSRDTIPPKLYSLGNARAVQTSYRNGTSAGDYERRESVILDIVPVELVVKDNM